MHARWRMRTTTKILVSTLGDPIARSTGPEQRLAHTGVSSLHIMFPWSSVSPRPYVYGHHLAADSSHKENETTIVASSRTTFAQGPVLGKRTWAAADSAPSVRMPTPIRTTCHARLIMFAPGRKLRKIRSKSFIDIVDWPLFARLCEIVRRPPTAPIAQAPKQRAHDLVTTVSDVRIFARGCEAAWVHRQRSQPTRR